MIVNKANLGAMFTGFKAQFNKGFEGAPSFFEKIAMVATSGTSEEIYGWLGQIPRVREWIGDRVINNLSVHGYTIRNKLYEDTIAVQRTEIEDDRVGIYGPLFEQFGREVKEHPDRLVFDLLGRGFNTSCYDGQYFFDTDHPVINAAGDVVSVSNMQAGAGPAWYIFDTSRAIKPLIYQKRLEFEFQALDQSDDAPVFLQDKFLYGVRGRSNVGFGLWQLAFASRAELNPANYAAARAAMSSFYGDNGRILGIRPTTLVVPVALESPARKIINNQNNDAGASNEWIGSAELVITPWLAG